MEADYCFPKPLLEALQGGTSGSTCGLRPRWVSFGDRVSVTCPPGWLMGKQVAKSNAGTQAQSVGASRYWKAAPSIHPISPCWAERKGDLWGPDNQARTTLTTPPAGIDKRPVLRLSLWWHSWPSPSAFAALHNPPVLPEGPQDFSWCCSSSAPPQAGQLGLALPGACKPCGKSLFDILFFRDTCSSVSQETICWLSR